MSKFWLIKQDPKKKKLSEMHLIESNYTSGNRIYYLNIEPGEYSLVGAYQFRKGQNNGPDTNYYYIMNRDSIKKNTFKVAAGQTLIVGRKKVEFKAQVIGSDEDIDDLGVRIFPGFKDTLGGKIGKAVLSTLLGGTLDAAGYTELLEENVTPELKTEIEKEVIEDFKETPWAVIPIKK